MQNDQAQVMTTSVQSKPAKVKKEQRPITCAEIHRVNLADLLKRQNGKMLGVTFLKKDMTYRKLNGRLGVTTPLKGGVNTTVTDARPYVTLWDAQKNEYRNVNLSTVMSVRCDRVVYTVIG